MVENKDPVERGRQPVVRPFSLFVRWFETDRIQGGARLQG